MKTLMRAAVFFMVTASLALYAMRREPAPSDDAEVVILEGKSLASVTVISDDGNATFEKAVDGALSTHVIVLNRKVIEKPINVGPEKSAPQIDAGPNGNDADAGVVDAPTVDKTFRFPSSSAVEKSLEKLFPLKARRVLKDVPADRLAAMGLDASANSVALTVDGKTHRFTLGEKTYGGQGYYLRADGGDVLLVESAALSGLMGTETKLAERRLLPISTEDVTRLVIQSGDKERVFVHQDREQPKKRGFAAEGALDDRIDEADGALSALKKLRALEYSEVENVPAAFDVSFVIERAEGPAIKGAIALNPEGAAVVRIGEWWARVSESQAKDVIDDVKAALFASSERPPSP